MAESPDNEVRDIDKISISVIFKDLDEYEQNVLIAFYGLCNSSPSLCGRLLGVSPQVITSQVNKIISNVRDRVNTINDDSSIHN